MLESRGTLAHSPRRYAALALLAAVGGLIAQAGCGGRTAVALLDPALTSSGGASPVVDMPSPSLPVGAGAPASAGAPPTQVVPPARVVPPAPVPTPVTPAAPAEPTPPAPPAPPPCESADVSVDDLRPSVTLLVDQSGSMRTPFPQPNSPTTRWSLVGDALFNPTTGVVKTFEGSVRFGVAFFTSRNGFAGGECPLLSEVQAATKNYEALRALYQSLGPDGGTPTGDSIAKLSAELQDTPSISQQSILLVTDGNPNTCQMPKGEGGQPQAVDATQDAYDAGIDTYVLGISQDIAGKNLQQLANAGKGEPVDYIYGVDMEAAQSYQASSTVQGLTAQFAEILNQIPFCDVRLSRDVAERELDSAHILLDGQALNHSSRNGYDLADPRHLVIVGAACDAIKAGAKELSVRISCDEDAGAP